MVISHQSTIQVNLLLEEEVILSWSWQAIQEVDSSSVMLLPNHLQEAPNTKPAFYQKCRTVQIITSEFKLLTKIMFQSILILTLNIYQTLMVKPSLLI